MVCFAPVVRFTPLYLPFLYLYILITSGVGVALTNYNGVATEVLPGGGGIQTPKPIYLPQNLLSPWISATSFEKCWKM